MVNALHSKQKQQRKQEGINNSNNNNLLGSALLEMSEQLLAPFAARKERKGKGNKAGRVRQLATTNHNNRPRRQINGDDGIDTQTATPTTTKNKGKKNNRKGQEEKEEVENNNNNNVVGKPVAPRLAVPDGGKCNSERIRHIIKKARGRNSGALKRNIQALAERTLGARYNVVCARSDFSYISNTEEFCQERVHGNTCYVFKQIARDLPFPEPPELNQFVRGYGAAVDQTEKMDG